MLASLYDSLILVFSPESLDWSDWGGVRPSETRDLRKTSCPAKAGHYKDKILEINRLMKPLLLFGPSIPAAQWNKLASIQDVCIQAVA